ncbi:O-antigen ligase family protein [Rhodopseudomonas pseudopalustris]|uniref:O-antigen ligase family protein n=1 Tax=Rhodopseudomonas pseudopalustris TaxID=1513892 RepID=UPI003F983493
MQPASQLVAAEPIAGRPLSQPLAYTVAVCIPVLAAASLLSPSICDIALAILLLISAVVIWHDPRQLRRPVLWLAFAWMAFVALSALWAQSQGVPGHALRNWHKHMFIAFGPLIALSGAAAWQRLQWRIDRLLLLFLAGLCGGAMVLLIKNGAIGMIAELRPTDSMMGPINRNFAALACGLAIIAITGLIGHLVTAPKLRRSMAVAVGLPLAIALAALLTLLVLLHSRGGYVGTSAGLAVWLISFVMAQAASSGRSRRSLLIAMLLLLAIGALAFGGYVAMQLSGRSLIEGSTGGASQLALQMLHGQFDAAYATANKFEARVQLLVLAADLFHQRPWLGWGPDAWDLLRTFAPTAELRDLNQFHNGYAQFLVCFGVIGAALMAVYLAALLSAAIQRRRTAADRLPPAMLASALALLTLLLVFNVSETVLLVKSAASTMMMLAALAALPIATATRVRGSDLG